MKFKVIPFFIFMLFLAFAKADVFGERAYGSEDYGYTNTAIEQDENTRAGGVGSVPSPIKNDKINESQKNNESYSNNLSETDSELTTSNIKITGSSIYENFSMGNPSKLILILLLSFIFLLSFLKLKKRKEKNLRRKVKIRFNHLTK